MDTSARVGCAWLEGWFSNGWCLLRKALHACAVVSSFMLAKTPLSLSLSLYINPPSLAPLSLSRGFSLKTHQSTFISRVTSDVWVESVCVVS